jgi:hypothetical protein
VPRATVDPDREPVCTVVPEDPTRDAPGPARNSEVKAAATADTGESRFRWRVTGITPRQLDFGFLSVGAKALERSRTYGTQEAHIRAEGQDDP